MFKSIVLMKNLTKKCDENQNKINLFGFHFYNFSFYWFTNLNIHVLEYLLTSRTFIKIKKIKKLFHNFPEIEPKLTYAHQPLIHRVHSQQVPP